MQNLLNQAFQLHVSGHIQEAMGIYMQMLPSQQDNEQLLFLLGTAYFQTGNAKEAVACLQKSLDKNPSNLAAHNNLGLALQDLKRPDEALNSYDQLIILKPDYANAFYNRGNALQDLKRHKEALASYDQAIALQPDHADAFNNRGVVLRDLKRHEEALASYDQAIALQPDHADAFNNRGVVLRDLKRHEEALSHYDQEIALKPDYADAFNNRGVVLRDLKRHEEALASYDQAIVLRPDFAAAFNNRGVALRDLKRHEEALASYDQALRIKPDYADATWNKSLLLILIGNYLEGWKLYESRLDKKEIADNYYKFQQTSWRGQEDIQGKTLLIYSEQGLGDVIQFVRYLEKVHQLGIKIILEVPLPLVSLVSTFHVPMTVVERGKKRPGFDAYCPLLSLPYIFKTTIETIPASIPYLFANKEKLEDLKHQLGNQSSKRIGLTWSGLAVHENDHNRSIPLDALSELLKLPFEWHSLQKEYQERDKEILLNHPEIHQHQDELNDFSDTAALIECMDIIISVDTSVAHLAGALGKPVWILLPFMPDYRWMLDREDCPWYPSAKLVRQDESRDWSNVLNLIKKYLSYSLLT